MRPRITKADAAQWTEQRLAQPYPGALHLIFHTIAAKYFPPATSARLHHALTQAGAKATTDSPLAYLSMEWDGPTPGAALTLTLWPDPETISLGRADFHGRWVTWQAPPP